MTAAVLDPTTAWLLVAGCGVVAFVTRGLFVVPGESLPLPAILKRVLRYAPGATLVAIIAPDLGLVNGHLALSPENLRLVAGLAAFAIAAATRSILLTIGGGMLVLTALRWLT